MKLTKRCLVILMTPIHVITSLCAVRTLNIENDASIDIVVYNPALSGDSSSELATIVKQLAAGFSYVKNIKAITTNDLEAICVNGNQTEASSALRKALWGNEYQEIYYAHDVMGFLYQLACITYKSGKRICYGDGLGIVFDKQCKLSLGINATSQKVLKKILRKAQFFIQKLRDRSSVTIFKNRYHLRNALTKRAYRPDQASLVIPIDYSGGFLKEIPLNVCDKQTALKIIRQIKGACKKLNDYIETLLHEFESKKKVLLLTENFAEAKRINFENEIDMWCSIINRNAEPGSVIFLKSHPGEMLPRNDAIKNRLSDQYEIVILRDEFCRYPIEIWEDLISNCKVLCMSYPCISLKYLYGIDVVNCFNNQFIENWFPETSWKLYKYNMHLFSEPVVALEKWDGNSVIWSGNYHQ